MVNQARLNSQPRVRVAIAEDDPGLLAEIASLLETRFDVVGRARNGRELVEMVRRLAPAVIVVDISMPEMNGIEAAREITKTCRSVKVLMLSGYDDGALIASAFLAGASGYVAKLEIFTELIPAIQSVLTGQPYTPNDFTNPRTKDKPPNKFSA